MIQLISNNCKCSGCSACYNICPQNAIVMKEDAYGFTYPEINYSLCIECGMCISVCPFKQFNNFRVPIKAYAAVNESSDVYNSSSGGAFISIAKEKIKRGGVVFGVAWSKDMIAEHQVITDPEGLKKIQGSKYVQSDQKKSYSEVKTLLKSGTEVLYTGTPCQIAGLKHYLGRDYDNLYTVDIICHGVPSKKMHTAYVNLLEEKYQAKIINMNYREKSNGWSMRLKCDFKKEVSTFSKRFEYSDSYYYNYFEHSLILRESCYHCPFARTERTSDITLGDYWGVEKYHPNISTYKGVSSVLVNNSKGLELINSSSELNLFETKLEWIVSGNGQLQQPSTCDKEKREQILEQWYLGGAKALHKNYHISIRRKVKNKVLMYTPYIVKDRIKRLVRKNKD